MPQEEGRARDEEELCFPGLSPGRPLILPHCLLCVYSLSGMISFVHLFMTGRYHWIEAPWQWGPRRSWKPRSRERSRARHTVGVWSGCAE